MYDPLFFNPLACGVWYGFAEHIRIKINIMSSKGARSQNNMQSKQMASHRPRPDVRDDLDSRSKEEQDTRGGNETHNAKDVRNNRPREKK